MNALATIDWVALVTMCVVLLLGTVGNLLVIIVFGWKKKNRTNYETLLLTLGVVDFLGAISGPSLFTYMILTKYKEWHLGTFGCKVMHTIVPVNITLSQGILILISFERYRGIVNPYRAETLTRKRLGIYLLAIVIVALIFESFQMYTLEFKKGYSCIPRLGNIKLARSAISVARDITALSVLILTNTRMSKAIYSSFQVLRLDREKHRRLASYKRLQKMLIVMVASLSICVMPADFLQLGFYICNSVDNTAITASIHEILVQCFTLLYALQVTNTFMNVIIYAGMDPEFKLFIKYVGCSCISQRHVMKTDEKENPIHLEPMNVTESI